MGIGTGNLTWHPPRDTWRSIFGGGAGPGSAATPSADAGSPDGPGIVPGPAAATPGARPGRPNVLGRDAFVRTAAPGAQRARRPGSGPDDAQTDPTVQEGRSSTAPAPAGPESDDKAQALLQAALQRVQQAQQVITAHAQDGPRPAAPVVTARQQLVQAQAEVQRYRTVTKPGAQPG